MADKDFKTIEEHEMKISIIALTKKYPFVRMDYYGFRSDWQQKL